jgi:uncharacterized protein YcbX
MKLGRVKQIFRYPIKSMIGESLDQVEMDQAGMRGDRCWSIRDESSGELVGAKRIPELMGFKSRYVRAPSESEAGIAEIRLPDGATIRTDDDGRDAKIAEALDRSVTLQSLRPADDLEFYRNKGTLPEDVEGYLRAMFARTRDEPLPDLSVFPAEIFQYSSLPGTFFDAFPLLVMTEAGLETLQRASAQSRFDVRRFRPNLLIDQTADDAPIPENDWCGKTLRIGDAQIAIGVECPRCVMTTHAFDDLPKDPTIMRTLVKEAGGNLGVYAAIERAGTIAVGDDVELV